MWPSSLTSFPLCLLARSSPESPGSLPSEAVAAAPVAGAGRRAAVVPEAGTVPPWRSAGAAGWRAGCRLQEFHQDSRRVGLQGIAPQPM